MDVVTLRDSGDVYEITLPGDILRASGLLEEEVEGAALAQTSLARGNEKVFLEYDPETRKVTFQLPEPPEEKQAPKRIPPKMAPGEEAVLNNSQ